MNRDKPLLILIATGSALCWWPGMIEPSIDFPRWILLVIVALITGFSTILSVKHWMLFVVTASAGALAGLCSGCVLFPSSDGIANSYAPLVALLAALVTCFVSLVAGLLARRFPVSNENHRRAVWVALVCCVAFGPVVLAVTPPLVAHRVARNDRLAAERFRCLKNAAERTTAEAGDLGSAICDAQALRRHYSGPPFSEEDWRRIGGNAVKQDGYFFMVKCRETGGYTIDASPSGGKANGTRRFCSDECKEWLRSQHLCLACTE